MNNILYVQCVTAKQLFVKDANMMYYNGNSIRRREVICVCIHARKMS